MKRKKKPVEYKDTFEFKLFPSYEYTKAQKLRFRFFQGRIEHWKAAVNYADAFHSPEQINLLYMIGYNPKISEYVCKNTESNLVVLCIEFPEEDLALYDRYWAMIDHLRGGGYADANGEITPLFYEVGQNWIDHRDLDDDMERIAQKHEADLALIAAYGQLKERCAAYYSRPVMIMRNRMERHINEFELDWMIKHFYPYGREQALTDAKAINFPSKISEALQLGLNHTNAGKVLGMPDGSDSYARCRKGIARCEMDINIQLRQNGNVDLVAIFQRMKAPPYGWDNDAFSAYCFGYAVGSHLSNTWIWDEVGCFPTQDVAQVFIRHIIRGSLNRRHSFVLISESGRKLADRFGYIFGVEKSAKLDDLDERIAQLAEQGFSERRIAAEIGTISNIAVHKRLMKIKAVQAEAVRVVYPFCNTATLLCKHIETVTRWPVATLDERLHEVLIGAFDNTTFVSTPLMDKAGTREAEAYFSTKRCEELRAAFQEINTRVPALIRERYGDVDMDFVYNYCTTQASGWLWSSKTFWDGVDRLLGKRKEQAILSTGTPPYE